MPKIYKVGGCVRDMILGIEPKDIDYTFVVDPTIKSVDEGLQSMIQYLRDNKYRIFLVTESAYTIRARIPYEDIVADFVMARKEIGYIPNTRTPILEIGTLEDDLRRRDFTVNAMAIDDNGNLIDLFNGCEHLKHKLLVTPLDPKVTLMDDPLRILRAIRFSITKKFNISNEIFEAMSQPEILQKLSVTVSIERIREELLKMMQYDTSTTIRVLTMVDKDLIPGLLDFVFQRGLWLKPTFEKKKI